MVFIGRRIGKNLIFAYIGITSVLLTFYGWDFVQDSFDVVLFWIVTPRLIAGLFGAWLFYMMWKKWRN